MDSALDIYVLPTAIILGKIILIMVPLILAVAYLTYAERKVMAAMQIRRGPNVVGWFGLLQPIADALKLPIRYIGVGETAADFDVFDAAAFVDAVLQPAKGATA